MLFTLLFEHEGNQKTLPGKRQDKEPMSENLTRVSVENEFYRDKSVPVLKCLSTIRFQCQGYYIVR